MTVDEVARVFAALGRFDVIRLSGGEPFLRRDFLPLARTVDQASRPLVLHITTNGSDPDAVEEFVASFPRPNVLRFLVSVDGLPAEHDANRGDAVSFAKAEETVRRLVVLRPRLGLAVSVNHTVISPRSQRDAAAVQAHFAALGVEVTTVVAYAESATYTLGVRRKSSPPRHPANRYPLHPDLEEAEVRSLVEGELHRTRTLRDPLLWLGKRYYLSGLLARLREHPSPSPRPRCVALRSHLRLLPDGSVPVCQFNGTVVGNLTIRPPRSLLRSSFAQAARRWVDACPGCWAECEVIPSAIYTGDILRGLFVHPAFAPSSHPLGTVQEEGDAKR